jgi:hypothetical protein
MKQQIDDIFTPTYPGRVLYDSYLVGALIALGVAGLVVNSLPFN